MPIRCDGTFEPEERPTHPPNDAFDPSGPFCLPRRPHLATLPTGTVTFLFTDIEGSTRLLQQLGNRYAAALAQYRQLIRTTLQRQGGVEINAWGDACFVAFPRAHDAVVAAIGVQRALATHSWPDGVAPQVRMGLHTGRAIASEIGYVGLDVHRAARISAFGRGGQILLSQATRDLVAETVPNGVHLQDLGEHRLKDLPHSDHLFQVVAPGLPETFPPLAVAPNNLPRQLTSFIGRQREIEEVIRSLAATRILTLVGPGGVGKTRLALQVANTVLGDFKDGAWVVELAALSGPGLVPQAVASVLGVREQAGRLLVDALSEFLQPRHLLLILDNCEHLLSACAHLAEVLLLASPNLRILTTSREVLGLRGEITWQVPPLSLPDPQQIPAMDLSASEAVRLFIERAANARPAFKLTPQNAEAIATVCRRLDGIPLAIELAAARIPVLSVEQISERLDDRFNLLTLGARTAPPRHQTLRAAMEWSYQLLSEEERILLRRLAVFAGGWTLDAAEAVCTGAGLEEGSVLEPLTQLVLKSLVGMDDQDGVVRYRFLETVRAYGLERLRASGEEAQIRCRHRDWYVNLAERVAPGLEDSRVAAALSQMESEQANLRGAFEWTGMGSGDVDTGLRLTAAMWRFWIRRGYWSEGRERLEALLKKSGTGSRALRARALNNAGYLANRQGDYAIARTFHEQALTIWRELGDRWGIGISLSRLSLVAFDEGNCEVARGFSEESLVTLRELGDNKAIAHALTIFGIVARNQGDLTLAWSLHEESLTIRRALGDKGGIAVSLNNLGLVALQQGAHARAHALIEESLTLSREAGEITNLSGALHTAGDLARAQLGHAAAQACYQEGLALRYQYGDRKGTANCLDGLAKVAHAEGLNERAAQLFGASEALRNSIHAGMPPADRADYAHHLAGVHATLGDAAFEAASAQGRAMTLEQAVEYALEEEALPDMK